MKFLTEWFAHFPSISQLFFTLNKCTNQTGIQNYINTDTNDQKHFKCIIHGEN